MKALPFLQQRIIGIHQKGVIKLLTQLLVEWSQAGEINDKPTGIELSCCEMKHKTAAVTMHETAVAAVPPLPMTTGIALERFAAGVRRRR